MSVNRSRGSLSLSQRGELKQRRWSAETFIDRRFKEIKTGSHLRSIIREETRLANEHTEHDRTENLILSLENQILFLEEEIRNKNKVIDNLINLVNPTKSVLRDEQNFVKQSSSYRVHSHFKMVTESTALNL